MKTIGIIGAGIAGNVVASVLAEANYRIVLWDPLLRIEKACGGGLTAKCCRRLGKLVGLLDNSREAGSVVLQGADESSFRFKLSEPIRIIPRQVLDHRLLKQSLQKEVMFRKERVFSIEKNSSGWSINGRNTNDKVDFLVLADGAGGKIGALFRPHPVSSAPYRGWSLNLPVVGPSEIRLKFWTGFNGYLWEFPGVDRLNVGIACSDKNISNALITQRMKNWVCSRYGGKFRDNLALRGRLIAAEFPREWGNKRFGGKEWAAVGEAADLVDPLSGEGIYYAVRSAELLCRSIIEENPLAYESLCRQKIVPELRISGKIKHLFYRINFVDMIIKAAGSSREIRCILDDYFSDKLSYTHLKKRIIRTFPFILSPLLRTAPCKSLVLFQQMLESFSSHHG